MEHAQHIIPILKEIARPAIEVASDTMTKEVIAIFQKDQSLLSLAIADHGRFLGVINRKILFFHHLARPFAMDLYGKKPIRLLMDENPVVLEP